MINIFTSSKTLTLQTSAHPQSVLRKFQARMGEDNFLVTLKNAFSISGEVVGAVDDRNVRLKYVCTVNNPLQPRMLIQVGNGPDGGAVLTMRYSTSLFARIFFSVFMFISTLVGIAALFGKFDTTHLIGLLLPIYGLIIIIIMRLLARRDQAKLERFVQEVMQESSSS